MDEKKELKKASEQVGSSEVVNNKEDIEGEFYDASEKLSDNEEIEMTSTDSKQTDMKQPTDKIEDSSKTDVTEGPSESTSSKNSSKPDGQEVPQQSLSPKDLSNTDGKETPQQLQHLEDSEKPKKDSEGSPEETSPGETGSGEESEMTSTDSRQTEMKQPTDKIEDSSKTDVTEGPSESTSSKNSSKPDGQEVPQQSLSPKDLSNTDGKETPQQLQHLEDSEKPKKDSEGSPEETSPGETGSGEESEMTSTDSRQTEMKQPTDKIEDSSKTDVTEGPSESTSVKNSSKPDGQEVPQQSLSPKDLSNTDGKETPQQFQHLEVSEKPKNDSGETGPGEPEATQADTSEEASESLKEAETSVSSNTETITNSKDTLNEDLIKGSSKEKLENEIGNPEIPTSQDGNSDQAGNSNAGSDIGSVTVDSVEHKESEPSGETEKFVEGEEESTSGGQDPSEDDGQTNEADEKEGGKQPTDQSKDDASTLDRLICQCTFNPSLASSTVDPANYSKQSDEPKVRSDAIEFWCELCSQPCCKKCSKQLHSNCSYVSKCDNVEVKMKDVLQERREDITKHLDEIERYESPSAREKKLLKNKEEVLSAIKKTCDDVIRLAKEKEKELRDEVEYVTKQELEEIQKDEFKRKETMDEYNRSLQEIDKGIDTDNLDEVFATFNTFSRQWIENHQSSSTFLEKRLVFLKDEKLRYYPREFKLGTLNDVEITSSKATDYSLAPLDPLDVSIISETISDPDDIVVVTIEDSEVLVVTDYINECVKAFYTSNGRTRRSKLDLYYRPHSITALSNNFLAVNYWNHNQITFIKVNATLTEWGSAVTRMDYKSITALDLHTLAAGSSHPSCIDIIDLQGKVLATIADPYNGLNLVETPRSMCTINGNILVSDAGSKSLYCLTPNGNVMFMYAPENDDILQWPRGIAVTGTGNILLADCFNHKVIQLTETGEYVKDLLTEENGLLRPQGLFVRGEKLYVSQEEDKCVKIFELSEICDA